MAHSVNLPEIAALVSQLPPAERKRLAEMILRELASPTVSGRYWSEIRGSVPYPLCDEDAQEWVSRSRQESEEARQRQWGDAG